MIYLALLSRHRLGTSGCLWRFCRPSGVVDVLLGGAMLEVGWRPECRWLACRVADGRCVRSAVKNSSIFRLFCFIVRNWCLCAKTLIQGLQNCSNLATTSSNVGCSFASSAKFSKMLLPLSPMVRSKMTMFALSLRQISHRRQETVQIVFETRPLFRRIACCGKWLRQ